MKIITHSCKNGEAVYVQVKDLLYLGRTTGDNSYIDEYIELINSQKGDNDFIRVFDEFKKNIIKRTDIVDFKGVYSESSLFLSRILINLTLAAANNEVARQKSEGIRDILAFKRGDLSYGIPLFSDGDIYLESEDGYFSFSSTILPDCYALKVVDRSDIRKSDYQTFLSDCLCKVKMQYREDVREDYQTYEVDNMIVVKFNKDNKKKDTGLLHKIKKVKNRVFKNEV